MQKTASPRPSWPCKETSALEFCCCEHRPATWATRALWNVQFQFCRGNTRRWWCSLAKSQHLPAPSSGHRQLLLQQHLSDACKVISNSSYCCPLMGDGLVNYTTLTQLSVLGDNKNTVSPPSKISSQLSFYRRLQKDPTIKIWHLVFQDFLSCLGVPHA